MENIKVGDTVKLNSGSPDLTVVGVDGNEATVAWMTSETFPVACLTNDGGGQQG